MDESVRGTVEDATDGVTLSKRFDADEYDSPAVVYELASSRSEPVTVRVVEPLPDALGPGDLGFVGADGTTGWTIKGPKLVFEGELAPGGERTTACTGLGEHADAVGDLLGRPDAFEVDPPGGEPAADGDLVVDQLVAELREGAVSERNREFLRQEFGVDGPATAGETPEDVQAQLDRIERALADLSETVASLSDDVEDVEEQLPDYDIEGRIATLDDALSEVDAFTDDVRAAFGETQ